MIWKDIIGYVAAFCTTFSFLPQAVQIIKTKDTSSISLSMYAIFTFGSFAWLLFGWVTGNWPVIVANSITFLLAALILYFKIRYRTQDNKTALGG